MTGYSLQQTYVVSDLAGCFGRECDGQKFGYSGIFEVTSKRPLVCTFELFELESDLPECCRSLISAFETLLTLLQLIRENEILNPNR